MEYSFYIVITKVRREKFISLTKGTANVDIARINKYFVGKKEGGIRRRKDILFSRVEERESIGLLNRTRFRKWIFVGWLGKIIIRRSVYACEDKSRTKI